MRRWAIGAGLCTTAAAWCGPTGLNAIPTADILRHREVYLEYSISGYEKSIDSRYYHMNAGVVGLFDRVELGWDNDFESTTTFNAKVLLLENHPRFKNFALSAGWATIHGGWKDPYVVGRYDLPQVRLHAGWQRSGGRSRAIAGIDVPIGESTFMLDHISSANGSTWAGVSVPVPWVPGLSVGLAAGRPNTSADGWQHYGCVGYAFRF